MICLLHRWNGCKCEKCGIIRDKHHAFSHNFGDIAEVCAICHERRYRDKKIVDIEAESNKKAKRLVQLKCPISDVPLAAKTIYEFILIKDLLSQARNNDEYRPFNQVFAMTDEEDALSGSFEEALWPVLLIFSTEEKIARHVASHKQSPLDEAGARALIKDTIRKWYDEMWSKI